MDCLFCKIRDRAIPAKILHEDDRAIAFSDVNPQAPMHALVVPRIHIAALKDLAPEDGELVGHLYLVATRLAREAGHSDYRTVFNCGAGAGQTVYHLHLHLLAGRQFQWPPG